MNIKDITSVSSLLQEMETSISSDTEIVEQTLQPEEMKKKIEEVKQKLSPLKIMRGGTKRKVTLLFKQLLEIVQTDESNSPLISSMLEEVSSRLLEVRQQDGEIEALICSSDILKHDNSLLNEEIVSASHYHLQQQKVMSKFHASNEKASRHSRHSSASGSNPQENLENQSEVRSILRGLAVKQEVKIPALKCKTFSGESDRFQFRSFLLSFENVFGSRRDLSDAAKLQYLKAHLSSIALKDVEHLPNVDDNYEVALQILKDLYLDVPFIIDCLFHKIDTAPVIDNKNLEAVRAFISEVRAHLHELKEFELDFMEEGSAGCKLLSHIVVDKLPSSFLRELKIETKVEYPSINIILDNYHMILKSMERIRGKNPSHASAFKKSSNGKKTSSFQNSTYSRQENTTSPKKSNISSESSFVKCKLCDGAHFMSSCTVYSSPASRKERCIEIELCSSCSSTKHKSKQCPAKRYGLSHHCFYCKSKKHISALCTSETNGKRKSTQHRRTDDTPTPSSSLAQTGEEESQQSHLCINTGSTPSGNILPTISLKVKRGNKIQEIRALLDFGSQRSYFKGSVMEKLGVNIASLPRQNTTVKTFLGEQTRTIYSIDLELNLCCGSYTKIPALVDPNLDVGFEVKGLMGAEYNIRRNNFKIADRFYQGGRHGDIVNNVECLLGIDALYLMKHFKVVNCIRGSAIDSCHGFVPFGPVRKFLILSQIEVIFGEENSISPQRKRTS
ncbi:UNVERIFIED_CONTAM: hypothetical protein RMT77_019672 [Armadillidium vulgare]